MSAVDRETTRFHGLRSRLEQCADVPVFGRLDDIAGLAGRTAVAMRSVERVVHRAQRRRGNVGKGRGGAQATLRRRTLELSVATERVGSRQMASRRDGELVELGETSVVQSDRGDDSVLIPVTQLDLVARRRRCGPNDLELGCRGRPHER